MMNEQQLPVRSRNHKDNPLGPTDSSTLTFTDPKPKLCNSEFCQKLALLQIPSEQEKTSIDVVNNHFDFGKPYSLGELDHVFARKYCPFCQLIKAILLDVFNITQEARNNEITVIWYGKSQGFDVSWQSKHKRTGAKFTHGERIAPCIQGGILSKNCGRVVHDHILNFSQIRRWLTQCETHHVDLCRPKSTLIVPEDPTGVFRLVDVDQNCIIRSSIKKRYVALSYVWGKTEPFMLLSKEEAVLAVPGELHKVQHRIPKTIRDVMQLLVNIGERYLWVDSMCLIQDNAEDLQKGIAMMSYIYQAAVVTVIAANSPDAGTGLPRMRSEDPKYVQYLSSVRPGLELMFLRAADLHLRRSTWNTRGWT
jgi:Heterokaryon incompatibility protein (HET)